MDPDRFFSPIPAVREIARELFQTVDSLPIVSPHGHCEAKWFAQNQCFANPADLIIGSDHYIYRMFVSQGISLDELGVARADGTIVEADPRKIWRTFAEHMHLFRGTPTSIWMQHSFEFVFGLTEPLMKSNADAYFDHIDQCLQQNEFRPRALYERFRIECLATTDDPLDELTWHQEIRDSGWGGSVIPTYRPDSVTNPESPGFTGRVEKLGALTGCNTTTWKGYLDAHRTRRQFFKSLGCTATDHSNRISLTASLSKSEAELLYEKALQGKLSTDQADIFRGQVITEMARMSIDDGLVLQLHCGVFRNHGKDIFRDFGADVGFDIPLPVNFVQALKPLLDEVGMRSDLTIIVYTLDETCYGRELAPLAGAYPALRLAAPWWFFDSVEGIRRFRERTAETAGFYNTAGFVDDTRAFSSIAARHDVSRRCDSDFLANLVATGRLSMEDARQVIYDLSYRLPKEAYRTGAV